jgi:hypothetical protein
MLAPEIGCCPPCKLPRNRVTDIGLLEGTLALQPTRKKQNAAAKKPATRLEEEAEKDMGSKLQNETRNLQQFVPENIYRQKMRHGIFDNSRNHGLTA